nr:MAG TPA: hypothetical protein [Herelleviridae sp.]
MRSPIVCLCFVGICLHMFVELCLSLYQNFSCFSQAKKNSKKH